jgi:hypothetical protein
MIIVNLSPASRSRDTSSTIAYSCQQATRRGEGRHDEHHCRHHEHQFGTAAMATDHGESPDGDSYEREGHERAGRLFGGTRNCGH